MKVSNSQVFSKSDAVLEKSLNHRLAKQNVILGNLANAATPGFRALGYEFEEQLRASVGNDGGLAVQTSDPRHMMNPGIDQGGDVKPDLFVKPQESIGNDGNSVDVDQEMTEMAWNQTLYRATVELLNRRMAMLRYGINGGR